MAKLEIRLKTFIPFDRVLFTGNLNGNISYFSGDNRDRSYASTSYRTYQRFEIDTAPNNYSVIHTRDTGTTHYTEYDKNGVLVKSESQKAPVTGLTYTKRVGSDGILYLDCVCDAANPFLPGSPAINYEFTLKVTRLGSFRITGKHDGFPAYEVWRKFSDRGAELIYLHDPRDTGESLNSLYPPMEHDVNAAKSA